MASMVHERVGVMACMGCGKEIPVKKTKHGTLTAPCAWCEFKNYAVTGTEHYKTMLAKVRLDPPKAEPAPAPPAPPAPGNGTTKKQPATDKLPWIR